MDIQILCLDLLIVIVAVLVRRPDLGHDKRSGLNPAQHPWLLYTCNHQEESMCCQLCMKYGKLSRNGSGKWVQIGITFIRLDKIKRHEHV